MADQKISELTPVTDIATGDAFVVVDATDNTTKQVDYNDLTADLQATLDIETTSQLNARDTANRARGNHTGTQLASTISNFDTEVANNTAVAANTAKVGYTDAAVDARLTTKGIEDGADVTDTANVTAAGALMDSEVTNLTAVKAFDPADYATASHTHTHADITDYDSELAGKTNTTAFTPTADYHVATKKYVDDNAAGGVTDGDKGDITVSSSGTVWTIDDNTIGVDELSATGTASALTYLRGDNTWATVTSMAGGDMLKSTYDTNDDGIVDEAAVITGQGALATLNTVGTAQIDNNAVTFDKVQDIATNRVLARSSAGNGSVEDLTLPNFRTLINVEDGATANDTDANLRDRSTHTGTQTASTISDFDTEVANNTAVLANTAKVGVTTQISNVVEDTTPQLGGNLDAQSNNLNTVGDVDYTTSQATVSALGNLGATEAIDFATGTHFYGTLDSNVTITFSNLAEGQTADITLIGDGTQRTTTFSDVNIWYDSNDGSAPAMPTTTAQEIAIRIIKQNGLVKASPTGNYALY